MNEEEKIRKRLENVEFNNETEDLTIIKEEKKEDKLEVFKDKKIIIGIVCIIIGIFIILLIVFFTKKDSNPNNLKEGNTEINEKDKEESIKEIDEYKDVSKVLFFNKFIYDTETKEITFENTKTKLDNGYYLKEGKDSLYEANLTGKVKYFTNESFKEVINSKGDFIYVKNNKEKLVGLYDKESKKVYILNKDSYSTSALKHTPYIDNNTIYMEDNFLVIKDNNKYGVYDVALDKNVIDINYEFIKYLGNKKFIAVKNEKKGIIDNSGKELTSFKYDSVEKNNDYYLVYDNKLHILDKNLKDLGVEIEIDGNKDSFSSYLFNNNLIIKTGTSSFKYYYLKDGKIEKLDILDFKISNNYFIGYTTFGVSLYDKNMNIIKDYEIDGIRYKSASVFLNTVLVLDYDKFYNINTSENLKSIKTFRRVYKDNIQVIFNKEEEYGSLTILIDDKELGHLDKCEFKSYIESDNNGITITNDKIIYNDNSGCVLIVNR